MSQTERVSPRSRQEAIAVISEYGDKARVIAGGTDLLIQMKKKGVSPRIFISFDAIGDLDYIRNDDEDGVRIGVLTTMRSLEQSPLLRSRFSALARSAATVGGWALRNRATIGGNLCNASPAADTVPALMVLGAVLRIEGAGGERIVPVEEFFLGPGRTVLKPGQMLTEIHIPKLFPDQGTAYLRQTRTKGSDLAIVGAAAMVGMEEEIVSDVRIALGAVAPTPIRAATAEAILRGKKPTDQLLNEAGRAAAAASRPIDDLRGSAEYRRTVVPILVKRAVAQAIGQATGEAFACR